MNYELTIEDISTEGEGIGRIEGRVAFVPGTYPGDKVRVSIAEDKGRFYKCALEEILEPSPDRVEPACAHANECGGCPLMGLSYAVQLEWKRRHVKDCLTRIAGLEAPIIRPILNTGNTLRYRNKAEFVLQGNRAGYYGRRTHRLVEIDDCPIQQELAIDALRETLAETKPTQKYFTRLVIRTSADGDVMVIKQHDDGEGTASCRILKDRIVTDACTLKTEVSPLSFYQVNPEGCTLLYSKVQEYAALTGTEKVLDLYCGAGSIGLSLAGSCERVIGVEVVRSAFVDANRNAAINGIANATFVCGKAEDVIDTKLQGVKADLVIVDPPRSGCAKSLLEAIGRIAPKKLIYVSCNPATLARDVKILEEQGFEFLEATPVDMFPQTVHVETVALMISSKYSNDYESTY